MFCFCIFGLEFSKTIVVFEVSALEVVYLQSFVQISKFLNLEPKMAYLAVLVRNFEKSIVIVEISSLELVFFAKFGAKIKILKFGIKNA